MPLETVLQFSDTLDLILQQEVSSRSRSPAPVGGAPTADTQMLPPTQAPASTTQVPAVRSFHLTSSHDTLNQLLMC